MTLEDLFLPPQTLPAMPEVVHALICALNAPDHTQHTAALAQLINRDGVISAQLLQRANSAAFKLPRPVGDVAQAILHLGLVNVRSLVISVGLMSSFSRLKPALLKPHWRMSLRLAAAAQHFAGLPGVAQDAALANTLGLLTPIGQLIMLTGMPDEMAALNAELHPLAPQRQAVERARFGFCSAEVAAELARRWRFPELFGQVLGAGAALPDTQPAAGLAALLQLAAWQTWWSDVQASQPQALQTWPAELAAHVPLLPEQCASHFPPWSVLCGALESALI